MRLGRGRSKAQQHPAQDHEGCGVGGQALAEPGTLEPLLSEHRAQPAAGDDHQRDPNFMHIAGDLFWQAMDVPMADQLAKRYQKALPPELQDKDGQDNIPPQVQAQIAKLQEEINKWAKHLIMHQNKLIN